MMIKNFDDLFVHLTRFEKQIVAVVSPEDLSTLKVIEKAKELQIAEFILIGQEDELTALINNYSLNLKDTPIINQENHKKAAEKAVELVKMNKAQAIMKGLVHSSTFLRPILNKETGFNIGKKVSQISVYENSHQDELVLLTDCAMAINPDLMEKKEIIENAVQLSKDLGYQMPRVAVLASLENVNPAMPDTIDAALLAKMNDRKQIKDCIVDGPLAYDNATSKEAAKQKKVGGPVAGHAQILLVPNLTVGNVLTKSLVYDARKTVASAVVGLNVPIVFTSRSESEDGKLATIALATYLSIVRRNQ
ncbi:bifunctional enoyl-CoA hydratase/phosphate acetyltransferase [Streptococcus zalophi]|uniref:Bifunctional enoyl-CoA hydratase/phosphate acetyltransferase n=1 Tax=Streptococcus zalophi TaxID=640031 RepID=A0A934UDS3_9STRE|nr:bifunctional enoyl-CoA hydratase/phosphate acetyltransferase [Streptococcus zalophi]MBJ8350024.1 bifunctional enoyl-CoA hydratase/phosphate acetyltransferase [Streptococcus zalophi]MCR8967030.1 bifunctional enoyl-CoA hydratase/phosphate acetyltransferase [Streptococcus zalophi]